MHTRMLCILLVLQAVVSFRAVPRILELFCRMDYCKLQWIPHFTSVINWNLRYGLSKLNQVNHVSEKWLAIIDCSIDIGIKKVLVVLRVSIDGLLQRNNAIELEDCECIGLEVMETVNGETVKEKLTDIFRLAGVPAGIIKDNGSDLARGVNLWQEKNENQLPIIEDISHIIANALKGTFEKADAFQRFIDIVSKGASRLRQTKLAFLIPPKIRTKGRFLGISKIGEWAEKVLKFMSKRGKAKEKSILVKLRTTFEGLVPLKSFILSFAWTVKITAEIMKILKNRGLNEETYEECYKLAKTLKKSKVKKRLIYWLEKHLHIQKQLDIGQVPLIVSSDIIESLFGKFKQIISRSPQEDMNRSVLIIPALCGKSCTEESLTELLRKTSHIDLQEWEKENISYTMRKQRSAFFNLAGYQNPGAHDAA